MPIAIRLTSEAGKRALLLDFLGYPSFAETTPKTRQAENMLSAGVTPNLGHIILR